MRAIRPYKNVVLEFAGSDPHSGMVDYAIRELGVDRLVWGGHGLLKLVESPLNAHEVHAIMQANGRRLLVT